MSNYYAAARSNYVALSDLEGLKNALQNWPISIHEHDGKYCLLSEDGDSGAWPYFGWCDETGEEIEFSFEGMVMPFVAEGEVLVIQETGAEKLRYLVGYSTAFVRHGDEIKTCSVNIDDIYEKAKNLFGVEPTTATY